MCTFSRSLYALVVISCIPTAGCSSSGQKEPIQFSLGFGLQLHSKPTSIVGPRLSLFEAENKNLTGLDFSGVLTRTNEKVTGLQLAPGANIVGGSTDAVQCAAVNWVDGRTSGLQLGVYNRTKVLRGIQFGLWNSAENGLLPHLPILNFGWSDAPATSKSPMPEAPAADPTPRRERRRQGPVSAGERRFAASLVQDGIAAFRRGDLDHAGRYLERATRIDSANAGAWANLGVVERRRGNSGAALAALKRAVDLDPDNATAWGNHGALLYRMERYDDAVESLERAVELGNSKAEKWLRQARAKAR